MNDDGSIEYREFIPACVQLIGVLRAKDAAMQAKLEKEAAAAEEAQYFLRGMSKAEIESMMLQAFALADKDGNGTLDQKEFQMFLKDMPLNLADRKSVV